MRLTIAAVGRAKAGPERTLYEHYAARITFPLSLREVEEKKPLKRRQLMRREGELLLSAVPGGARLVALDERGQEVTSKERHRPHFQVATTLSRFTNSPYTGRCRELSCWQ